jgi:hypothetical protein
MEIWKKHFSMYFVNDFSNEQENVTKKIGAITNILKINIFHSNSLYLSIYLSISSTHTHIHVFIYTHVYIYIYITLSFMSRRTGDKENWRK